MDLRIYMFSYWLLIGIRHLLRRGNILWRGWVVQDLQLSSATFSAPTSAGWTQIDPLISIFYTRRQCTATVTTIPASLYLFLWALPRGQADSSYIIGVLEVCHSQDYEEGLNESCNKFHTTAMMPATAADVERLQ